MGRNKQVGIRKSKDEGSCFYNMNDVTDENLIYLKREQECSSHLKRTETSVNLARVDEAQALTHGIGCNDFGQRYHRLS
jgi:hypothetical protein